MRRTYLALPLSLLLLAPADAANAADPPARVGRLSYAEGTVSFHPPGQGQGDWAPATVNYPVTTGESFWTDANARAEIEIGPAELRLDQASELDIALLDDRSTALQLDQGVLNLHLAQMTAGEITVTTPRGRVTIAAPGDYDIDAGQPDNGQPSDQMQVSVFAGAARVEGERGTIDIRSGQAALIGGEPANVQFVAADPSDFDNWARDREHREDVARLPQALPPAVTGYQDLAAYGRWSDDPDYGEVWYPSDVPAGWAPYRYGHWAWVDPWGWTWIDDAPWGFAPFHYGRWIDRDERMGLGPGRHPAAAGLRTGAGRFRRRQRLGCRSRSRRRGRRDRLGRARTARILITRIITRAKPMIAASTAAIGTHAPLPHVMRPSSISTIARRRQSSRPRPLPMPRRYSAPPSMSRPINSPIRALVLRRRTRCIPAPTPAAAAPILELPPRSCRVPRRKEASRMAA